MEKGRGECFFCLIHDPDRSPQFQLENKKPYLPAALTVKCPGEGMKGVVLSPDNPEGNSAWPTNFFFHFFILSFAGTEPGGVNQLLVVVGAGKSSLLPFHLYL